MTESVWCPHGTFVQICKICKFDKQQSSVTKIAVDPLEPMFLDVSLFERPTNSPWTTFEYALLGIVMNCPALKGIKFSERLAVVDVMREAGLAMIEKIESHEEEPT